MATAAAWGLGHWSTMEEYVRCIPKGSFDDPFYQALLHIHNQKFSMAQNVRTGTYSMSDMLVFKLDILQLYSVLTKPELLLMLK